MTFEIFSSLLTRSFVKCISLESSIKELKQQQQQPTTKQQTNKQKTIAKTKKTRQGKKKPKQNPEKHSTSMIHHSM